MNTGKPNTPEELLGENHRRSLTSALTIVEQLLNELEGTLASRLSSCCVELVDDITEEEKNHNREVIKEARRQIWILAGKYRTNRRKQSIRRIIDAKKTRIWEVLIDTRAKRQKSYGAFPKELVAEYDGDIDGLLKITDKIVF